MGMGQAVLGSWEQTDTAQVERLGFSATAERSVRSFGKRGHLLRWKRFDVGALPPALGGQAGNKQSQMLLPPSQETVISPPTHCSQTTLSDDASYTTWLTDTIIPRYARLRKSPDAYSRCARRQVGDQGTLTPRIWGFWESGILALGVYTRRLPGTTRANFSRKFHIFRTGATRCPRKTTSYRATPNRSHGSDRRHEWSPTPNSAYGPSVQPAPQT